MHKSWARWELVGASSLTIVLISFHLRFFFSDGPLWRDEVSTFVIAITGSLGDLWANLHHDSFPVLWNCMLRIWFDSGIGRTDQGMRGLGLVIGLSLAGTAGAIAVCLYRHNRQRALLTFAISAGCGAWMSIYRNVVHGRNLMAPMFRASTTYGRVLWK